MEKIKIYKKETTPQHIVVSVENLNSEADYESFEFSVSNAYSFRFDQYVFVNNETKKVILNNLLPNTLYRIDCRILCGGTWHKLESVFHRTEGGPEVLIAVKPTGALASDAEGKTDATDQR